MRARAALAAEAVLSPTKWCVLRSLDDGHLVYNPQTDELHVLTPFARYLYELCDASRTVDEVANYFAPAVAHEKIVELLASLVERGVLAVEASA